MIIPNCDSTTVRRYSVKDKNLTLYFIYLTTLPGVKKPFSPKQHSKFRGLGGLQNF